MHLRGLLALALSAVAGPALAAPVSLVFDHDIALREAGYRSLGAILLPISAGTSADYAVGFTFVPGSDSSQPGNGRFESGGSPTVLPSIPAGSAIGFRLIAATAGEAEHTVTDMPAAGTLSGAVDPLAIGLLLPAVQQVRETPPPSGDGPTCEPPPEPICEPPADGDAPFEPVEWLVFDFGEPLLSLELLGSYAFRPASADFGPRDMAVEVHYLRRVEIDEPATYLLFGAGLLGAAGLFRPRRTAARPGRFAERAPAPFAAVLAGCLLGPAAVQAQSAAVVVNGSPLAADDVAALGQAYGAVAPGHYWYDALSGLYGVEGGPALGQIAAGLPLGGRLQADASGGGTGVFINGREIHPGELAYLMQLYGAVPPGRYWLDASGVGGVEGGPPAFDLAADARRASGGGSTMFSPDGKSSLSTGKDGCMYFSSGDVSASTC